MVRCAGCERPILDRFLLQVLDKAWHTECVQCCDCGCSLTEKCFSRNGRIYCKNDFFRRFGSTCAGCLQGVSPSDLVRKARDMVFHVSCFTCAVCSKQLLTGEELYIIDEKTFVCKGDYFEINVAKEVNLKSVTPLEDRCLLPDIHDAPEEDLKDMDFSESLNKNITSDENEDQHSCAKKRGPRTTIKTPQLETLKAAFLSTPKPSKHIREALAQKTGLNMRVIQVWFQNRRSKERRMKQLSALSTRENTLFWIPWRTCLLDSRLDNVAIPGSGLYNEYFGDIFSPGSSYNFLSQTPSSETKIHHSCRTGHFEETNLSPSPHTQQKA